MHARLGITVNRFIYNEQQEFPQASGEFSEILAQIALASKIVSMEGVDVVTFDVGGQQQFIYSARGVARFVYDASLDELVWVSVNPDESGSVRLVDYNGGLEACWDADHQDVACP